MRRRGRARPAHNAPPALHEALAFRDDLGGAGEVNVEKDYDVFIDILISVIHIWI